MTKFHSTLVGAAAPVLLFALACGRGESDESTEDPASVEPSSPLALLPDSMLLRRGACPFECCIYRDWTARAPIDVLAAPEVGSDILWKIDPNEGFRAATGHVEVTGLTQVVVMREAEGFTTGDTLFVLDYAGEGFFNVWHAGTVSQPMQFWTDEEWTLSSRAAGYSLGEYSAEWWIEVTGPTGATGWVQGATAAFDGAGRDCGG